MEHPVDGPTTRACPSTLVNERCEMKIKCVSQISISVMLCCSAGFTALAQSPEARSLLASANSIVAGSSNPSGFNFVPAPVPNGPLAAAPSGNGVMGYQAWKQLQVEESKKGLEKLQALAPGFSKLSAGEIAKNPKLQRLDQRMRQTQLNLEVAQELSLNDYFLIYLSQFKSKDLLAEAAKHLTPEELGELLLAYQHNVLRADQVDAPANGLLSGANHQSRPSTTNREAEGSKDSRPRLN